MENNINNVKNTDNVQINISELLFQIITARYIIIGIILFCTLAMFLYTQLTYVARYKTCAKMYIVDSDATTLNSSELVVSTYLAKDYIELITDRAVLNEVREEMNLGMSYGALKNCVSVKSPEDTRIIEIYVTRTSPQEAMRIANKICEVSKDKITELMEVDRVNIFSEAYLPENPIPSNLGNNMVYGFVAGVLIALVYVFIIYSMNDKINSIDDIEKHLGIAALGSIPYHNPKNPKKGYDRYNNSYKTKAYKNKTKLGGN